MSLSRRLFAALMPAAVAAPAMAGGVRPDYPPHPPPLPGNWVKESTLGGQVLRAGTRLIVPPSYTTFLKLQEAAQEIQHKLYMRKRYNNNLHDLDFDITSLKSVSHQHKINMQVKRDEDRRKNERSFTESLIDELGLKEYMEKRNQLDGSGEAKGASSGSW